MSFDTDLAIGHRSEERVLRIIQRRYPEAYRVLGMHVEYDIFVPEMEISVEVKYDKRSLDTGNIVVEVNHPIGKPSGLLRTTADYWVHDTSKELIWIKPDKIKDCIMVYNYKPCDWAAGDDRHAKRVYLVPIEVYRTFASMYYDYEP